MPATGSRWCALPLALALALGLGCTEREVPVTPFRISATTAAGDLSTPDGNPGFVQLDGIAHVQPTVLVVDDAGEGPVTLSFDPKAAPMVAFPQRLDGQPVTVQLAIDPGHTGPGGEVLRIPGLRIATGAGTDRRFQFFLGEATYTDTDEVARIPPLFQLNGLDATEDWPPLRVASDGLYFEPAECGLVYYDRLELVGLDRALDRDEQRTVAGGDPAQPPWIVRHVLSWHRVGDCPRRTRAWTQVAMWR